MISNDAPISAVHSQGPSTSQRDCCMRMHKLSSSQFACTSPLQRFRRPAGSHAHVVARLTSCKFEESRCIGCRKVSGTLTVYGIWTLRARGASPALGNLITATAVVQSVRTHVIAFTLNVFKRNITCPAVHACAACAVCAPQNRAAQ